LVLAANLGRQPQHLELRLRPHTTDGIPFWIFLIAEDYCAKSNCITFSRQKSCVKNRNQRQAQMRNGAKSAKVLLLKKNGCCRGLFGVVFAQESND
jgi:hypothetical protein